MRTKALEHVEAVNKSKSRPGRLDLIKGSKAISAELGIDQATCLKLIHSGEIPAFFIGNTLVVQRSMLHAWVQLQELRALIRQPK